MTQKDSNILVILGICLTIHYCLTIGMLKLDGIYFLPFQQELGASATEISTIYSASNGFFFLCAPIYGAFFKLTGARTSLLTAACLLCVGSIGTSQSSTFVTLFVCFSVLRGTGSGLIFLCLFTISGKSYTHQRAFVNNLFGASSSMFAAISAPILQIGIEHYSWHGVMLIQSGILLNIIPISWLSARFYQKTVNNSEVMSEKLKCHNILHILLESLDVHMLKDGLLLMYCIANSFNQMVRVMQAMYLVRYAQSIGIPDEASSTFITIYQTTFIGTVLLMGYLMSKVSSDSAKTDGKVIVKTSTVIATVSFLQGVVVFIPIIWKTYIAYVIYTLLVGVLSGASGSLPISIIVEFFGSTKLSSAMGFRGLFFGIFTVVCPPVIGKIVDINETYQPTLYATALFGFVGAIMFIRLQILIDRRHRQTSNIKHDSLKIVG